MPVFSLVDLLHAVTLVGVNKTSQFCSLTIWDTEMRSADSTPSSNTIASSFISPATVVLAVPIDVAEAPLANSTFIFAVSVPQSYLSIVDLLIIVSEHPESITLRQPIFGRSHFSTDPTNGVFMNCCRDRSSSWVILLLLTILLEYDGEIDALL